MTDQTTPPTPAFKPNPAEASSLGGLLDLLNATDGGTPPIGAALATPTAEALVATPEPGPEAAAPSSEVWIETPAEPPPAPPPPVPARANKFFFTGRLGVGKDFVAAAAGAKILSFAEPLYAIASHYFGVEVSANTGKDLPGIREFLQFAGQIGRNVINEKYPLTAGRALFVRQVREDGSAGHFTHPTVDWDKYGRDADIWLNACVARANEFLGARVAVTNCRFPNEFARLQAEGFSHYHVMTSAKTWSARLLQAKLTPESPAVKDLSEQLAAKLDANVIKQVSTVKTGPKIRAIWSDEAVPKPSERLHTIESFLKSI